MNSSETIVALATPAGIGAIGVIRLSGADAFEIADKVFKGKKLSKQAGHTAHFGKIINAQGETIDEVLATVFRAPRSYTRENTVEFSCHGSPYILQTILNLLQSNGARAARAGEYTMRAFLNGQLDLAQAEAVADLIASENEAAHRAAIQQMRGGFSEEIKHLREELVHFASLIELELDFGEEDVEFADRAQLRDLISKILFELDRLKTSFKLGNVIKNGIPVAIVGKPNAGKSTLLNALLNEERAIVSPIAGTTRDVIEDSLIVEGIKFRLMDTAGLRQTTDTIEAIGVDRAIEKLKEAKLVLYLFDAVQESYQEALASFQTYLSAYLDATFILVANKIDEFVKFDLFPSSDFKSIAISAKEKDGLDSLKKLMLDCILSGINPAQFQDTTLVTNARHASALESAHHSLSRALSGIETGITGDLIAMDIRSSLRDLGEIIGDTDVEDLLDNIFSKFCIGK